MSSRAAGFGFTVALVGRPGAGKGTQAAAVADRLGFAHISTGELARAVARRGDAQGHAVGAVLQAGELLSDDLVMSLVTDELHRVSPVRGVLLDGFPRTLEQMQALLGVAPVDLMIELDVPARRILERLGSRGRNDDIAATVHERLHLFEAVTRPMIRWFAGRGTVVSVDGDGPPELVTADVLDALSGFLTRR